MGLEAAVTELAAGVDELKVDLLQGSLLGVHQQRLPVRITQFISWNFSTFCFIFKTKSYNEEKTLCKSTLTKLSKGVTKELF